jgi:hypothetical protein
MTIERALIAFGGQHGGITGCIIAETDACAGLKGAAVSSLVPEP